MIRRNRIPEKDSEFHLYITATTKLLREGNPPGWQRLDFQPKVKDKWFAAERMWKALYAKNNSPLKRTPFITKQKNDTRKAFIGFANRELNRLMGRLEVTEADRNTFRLCSSTRGYRRRGKIKDRVIPSLRVMGGAFVEIKMLIPNADGRLHRHPLADAAEIRYALLSVGEKPPRTPDECPRTVSSKKAKYILKLEHDAVGKKLCIWFRWANWSNPENCGPWSRCFETVVC